MDTFCMSYVFNSAHVDGYAFVSGLHVSLVARVSVSIFAEQTQGRGWPQGWRCGAAPASNTTEKRM